MKSKDLNEDVEDVLVDDDLEAAEDSDDEMKHPEFVVKLVLYFCNRLTRGLNQKWAYIAKTRFLLKSKDLNEDVEDVLVDDDLEAAEDAKQEPLLLQRILRLKTALVVWCY